jgi:hypothetical protein
LYIGNVRRISELNSLVIVSTSLFSPVIQIFSNDRDQVQMGGSVIADTLIAASMVYLVRPLPVVKLPLSQTAPPQLSAARKSTWSEVANRNVTKLIHLTIETGALSAAAAAVDLGLFLCLHNNLHAAM